MSEIHCLFYAAMYYAVFLPYNPFSEHLRSCAELLLKLAIEIAHITKAAIVAYIDNREIGV